MTLREEVTPFYGEMLALSAGYPYSYAMDITALSTTLTQQRVQQDAAVQVQKMAMDTGRSLAEGMMKVLESSQVLSDPSLGNKVDLFA